MKRLAMLAALVVAPAVAHAQAAEGTQAEGAQAEAPSDPSRYFNFFNFAYRGKDEFGGPLGDGLMEEKDGSGHVVKIEHEEEPMSPPFVLMLLNFGILLVILAKYGGPPARKLAQERHDEIKSALDEAAKLRKQAADKLAEYETRLKDADAQIKALADGMRADAEADRARILAAAEALATQVKHEAELRIAAEIELARATLTREVTLAATSATAKLLLEQTTPADQHKLVASFISDVQTTTTREAR